MQNSHMFYKALMIIHKVVPPIKCLHTIAVFSLLIMAVLTVLDVCMRSLFTVVVPGVSEISEFIMVLLVSFGLSYCAIEKNHIHIEFFIVKFSRRRQLLIRSIGELLGLTLFSFITWQMILYTHTTYMSKQASIMLDIPIFPFVALVTVGSAMFCLIALKDFLDCLWEALRSDTN